jgi:hypothetical protein
MQDAWMTSDAWYGKVMPIYTSYSMSYFLFSDMEVTNFAHTFLCFPLLVTWLVMFYYTNCDPMTYIWLRELLGPMYACLMLHEIDKLFGKNMSEE